MTTRNVLLAFVGAALAVSSAGCFVQSSDNSPPPPAAVEASGTVTIDWALSGSKDPNVCHQSAVDRIRITVNVAGGGSAGTYEQDCGAFATSIPLGAGSYTADAVLVDAAGNPRTTSVPVNPFTIRGNDNLDIPIDFPPDSFF